MTNFKIISDSSCDLPPDFLFQYDIKLVPYYVSLDRSTYLKEGVEIGTEYFYKTLREEVVFPKTSLPSIHDYCDAFKEFLDNDLDILCICLTSKFSGSYQSAVNAQSILSEEYHEQTIIVIDSCQATAGQGLLVYAAAKLRESGMNLVQTADAINKIKLNSQVVFTVDSLEYLKRGGRIGKVSAFAGSLLNIKPIIRLKDGELSPHSKIRGRNKAISEVVSMVIKDVEGQKDDFLYAVLHSDCYDEAKKIMELLQTEHHIATQLPPCDIGVTIGSHIGPTAIGIAYIPKP